jgi:predicted dehydrogenase/threonine dehydrogenase-like Zn-dependent dehydrogenase
MRQVIVRRGHIRVEDVPAPLIEDGHVLVEVAYSLISAGTEASNVRTSRKSLVERAIEQPDQVRQVVDTLRRVGVRKTVAKVRGRLDAGNPAGYSCAGVVVQVGRGVEGVEPGDLVACAGGGIATHAEVVLVPRNLVVKVPEGCDLRSAASVTLGAIALQGVRRADVRLGEVVAVIGLGLLGQLTVQLLKAAGCRVLGFDLDQRRVALAAQLGADYSAAPSTVDVEREVRNRTAGHGVDVTIITAAAATNALAQQAMELTRKKGRVVVVGDVGLGLKRSPFYEKEIDFLISCSYGPGRYDNQYEEEGVDYPYAFVRWTENRNMAEYLRLVADDKIELESILEQEYDIADAAQAFEQLQQADNKPLGVTLRYPRDGIDGTANTTAKWSTKVLLGGRPRRDRLNVSIIGAGNFAQSMHLPNLADSSDLFNVYAVVSATGHRAKATAHQYGATYAATDYAQVLADPDVDAVMITTRHHLHAQQVVAALQAGKHVYCEKPLALSEAELRAVVECYGLDLDDMERAPSGTRTHQPVLTVGFNRRFSPAAARMHALLQQRQNPLMATYRVNAGYVAPDNWVHGPQGGGRLVGEACHMLDMFQYLVGSPVVAFDVQKLGTRSEHVLASDNASVTLTYADGSVCTLLYTALGDPGVDKEYMEVHWDGKSMVLRDYQKLDVYGVPKQSWSATGSNKGHAELLRAWGKAIREQSCWPISFQDIVQVSRISIALGSPNE